MGGADPNGSPEKPYLIEDLDDFDEFASNSTYWVSGVHTKLMTDIDLDPNLPGRQIYTTAVIAPDMGPGFEGVFDGNDFSIKNLIIDGVDPEVRFIGLFGIIGFSAEVKNLGIDNITIKSNSTIVGGLTGVNSVSSTITNCSVTGSISGWGMVGGLSGSNEGGSITDSYVIGTISGDNIVGGICGKNLGDLGDGGTLNNCFTAGTINGNEGSIGGLVGLNFSGSLTNCYSNSDVNGSFVVGGVAGSNNSGNLINCYSTGDVSGGAPIGGLVGSTDRSSLTNCYSTGNVSGDNPLGALIGFDYGLNTINNCFWDVETTGIADLEEGMPDTDGMIGLSTALMQTQSTFTGWDFSTPVWMMLRENEDYPRLAWQEVFAGDIAGLYGVDFIDFTYLSQYWGLDDCNGLDDCGRADIDESGSIDIGDLVAVANDWLLRI